MALVVLSCFVIHVWAQEPREYKQLSQASPASHLCVLGGYAYICMIYKFKCSAHMCNMCGDQRPYLVSSLTALYLVFFLKIIFH